MHENPLVSIMMPVFNSYDFVRSENRNLIVGAIQSLLSQTYKNIELIILDNQSTDNTQEICKNFAQKDKRIIFQIDSERRYPEAGIAQASKFATGKYCMIANDDDYWDPEYIETLVNHLEANPEIDLCYSNGNYININNAITGKICISENQVYSSDNSPLSNLTRYFQNRNPIPISFGIFKRDAFTELLPYEKFDELKANIDNILIIKLFIKNKKIHFINKTLFNYRLKKRVLDPGKVTDMPSLSRKDLIGFYYLRHQFLFQNKITETFCKIYNPTQNELDYVKSVLMNSLFKHSKTLYSWFLIQYKEGGYSKKTLNNFAKRYALIVKKNQKDFPKINNFTFDNKDNIRFEPILNLNLLQINQKSLADLSILMKYYEEEDKILIDLSQLIESELSYTNHRIDSINGATLKTPPILSNLTSQQKNRTLSRKPKISVITASYNLAELVEETMRSISNQSSDSFEHIVIDGASKDGSVELLKKYPNIILISEKDHGYPDAFWKGLRIAKGDYVLQCAISDGYANIDWFKKCIETLDSNKHISLVWGFAGRLTENSKLIGISRPQFHYKEAPREAEMFNYWLKTFFIYPEGNLCVRKSVILKCYPKVSECNKNILDWLEFSYRFNRFGYLSIHIPILANFGRTHGDQLGERLTSSGKLKTNYRKYKIKIMLYRTGLLLGISRHSFIDSDGKILNVNFNKIKFVMDYIKYKISNYLKIDSKFLRLSNYIKFARKVFYNISKL